MSSRFFIDTCSLIAIQYSGYFNEVSENLELVVTETVIKELRSIAKFNDQDANCARMILDECHILVTISSDFEGDAEKELMDLSMKEGSIFVTDDIKAIKKAPKGLNILNSIHLVYILFRKDIIDLHHAVNAFNRMRKKRDWRSNSLSSIGIELLLKEDTN